MAKFHGWSILLEPSSCDVHSFMVGYETNASSIFLLSCILPWAIFQTRGTSLEEEISWVWEVAHKSWEKELKSGISLCIILFYEVIFWLVRVLHEHIWLVRVKLPWVRGLENFLCFTKTSSWLFFLENPLEIWNFVHQSPLKLVF